LQILGKIYGLFVHVKLDRTQVGEIVHLLVFDRAMKILVGSHEDRLFVLQHGGLQMLTEVII